MALRQYLIELVLNVVSTKDDKSFRSKRKHLKLRTNQLVSIAVDVMGGDHAPGEIVKGALQALDLFPVKLVLVGPELAVQSELTRLKATPDQLARITVKNATEIVEMSESPTQSFKRKKDSSIRVGINALKQGNVEAFVSAGNTGAVMTAATLVLGRISGVERPAIATVFPSMKGQILLLDMGSNVDCKPHHLVQFGVMGSSFSQVCMGVETPRVALLNIGEEAEKGNEVTQAAYPMFSEAPVNFIGNIESKQIMFDEADVIVCDGFVGNNILKFGEGITKFFIAFFKQAAKTSLLSKIGLVFLYPALKRFKKSTDHEEFGGAPLLGVNGVTIIAHGSSHAKAIMNAIRTAFDAIESQMISKIAAGIEAENEAHKIASAVVEEPVV